MRVVVAGKGPAWEHIGVIADVDHVPAGGELPPGDVLLSVQYDRRIGADELVNYRQALNLHFGPLPELRGCFPTKWAIINGEPAGVTLHHMTPRLDDGPVVDCLRFLPRSMTDLDVYKFCNALAVRLFRQWWPHISTATVPPGVAQDESLAKYYPRRLPFDGVMPDVDDAAKERIRRAFTHPPYPGVSE